MITKKFEVKNFGRHKDVSMTVDGPIVGILGPNGSGKSTLLEAFEFSLTGSTGEHTLAQLVRNGEGNASVLHVFEKDGKEGTIRKIQEGIYHGDAEWGGGRGFPVPASTFLPTQRDPSATRR